MVRHKIVSFSDFKLINNKKFFKASITSTIFSPSVTLPTRFNIFRCFYSLLLKTNFSERAGSRFSKVPKTFRVSGFKSHLWNCQPPASERRSFNMFSRQQKAKRLWSLTTYILSAPFLRYKGNCDTQKWPVKFRDLRDWNGPLVSGMGLTPSANPISHVIQFLRLAISTAVSHHPAPQAVRNSYFFR